MKYKIWDTKNKKWFEPVYKAYEGKIEELSMLPDGSLQLRTESGRWHESSFEDMFKNVIFSGKLDCNENEIYEGDILRNPIIGDLWIVKFKECAFYACLIGHDYEALLGPLEGFEIVGNIFENPELIKS